MRLTGTGARIWGPAIADWQRRGCARRWALRWMLGFLLVSVTRLFLHRRTVRVIGSLGRGCFGLLILRSRFATRRLLIFLDWRKRPHTDDSSSELLPILLRL